jgi:hypothetical protein
MTALMLDKKSIFSPLADFIVTSGLSILIMIGLIIFFFATGGEQGGDTSQILPKLLVLQVLLNWPHFLVSYRLLYSNTSNLAEYPMATVVIPAVLLAICVGATLPVFGGGGIFDANVTIAYFLWVFGSLYLAWHYTGQTWGVMMVFSHLTGLKLTAAERLILRSGLRVLIAWHVIWGLETLPPLPYVNVLQQPIVVLISDILAVIGFASGATIFVRKALKSGPIDLRIIGPWVAVYMWYLVLWLMPDAFMFVQLSHAFQYMIFPARVEMNRDRAVGQSMSKPLFRTAVIYTVCVIGGLLIFYIPEIYMLSPTGGPTLAALIAIAINVHHYYTDSAIWKMRKDGVRQRLFAHLQRP